jgi:hypothetical protein
MNVEQIMRASMRMIGDTSGAMIQSSDVLTWMNEGQLEVVRRTACLADTNEVEVEAGVVGYDLPGDFLDFIRVTLDGRKLRKTTVQEVDNVDPDRDLPDSESAQPKVFYKLGTQIKLFPKPATDGTLEIEYTRQPTQLIQNADIPEIPVNMHGDILQYCIAKGKEMDEDQAAAGSAMAVFEHRLAQSLDDATDENQESYPAVRLIPGDEG